MPSPIPEPTALKLAKGNPGKRKLNDAEPAFPAGAPKKPAHLKGEAAAYWKHVVPILESQGLATQADLGALVALCQSYAEMVQAQAVLDREGHVIQAGGRRDTEDNGTTVVIIGGQSQPHPAIARQRSAWASYRAYCQQFGLTASSRTKVRASPPKAEASGKARFFQPRGTA